MHLHRLVNPAPTHLPNTAARAMAASPGVIVIDGGALAFTAETEQKQQQQRVMLTLVATC